MWAKAHAEVGISPHFPTSRLSPFFVPTSEPSEKVPYCDVVVHFPIRLYFSDTQHPGFRRLFQIYPSYVGYCSTITRYWCSGSSVQQPHRLVSRNSIHLQRADNPSHTQILGQLITHWTICCQWS